MKFGHTDWNFEKSRFNCIFHLCVKWLLFFCCVRVELRKEKHLEYFRYLKHLHTMWQKVFRVMFTKISKRKNTLLSYPTLRIFWQKCMKVCLSKVLKNVVKVTLEYIPYMVWKCSKYLNASPKLVLRGRNSLYASN